MGLENRHFDSAIIGGGACGLYCAIEASRLAPSQEILLLEEKSKLGGEGGLSDGKLKVSPEFSTLYRRGLISNEEQIILAVEVIEILERTGVRIGVYGVTDEVGNISPDTEFYGSEQARIERLGIPEFKIRGETCAVLHIGTDQLQNYIRGLIAQIGLNVTILPRNKAEEIAAGDSGFRISLADQGHFFAKNVVLCPGRRRTDWALDTIRSLGGELFEDEALIGGRVVVPADSLWESRHSIYAPCYRDSESLERTFNFCTCEGGRITESTVHSTVNGAMKAYRLVNGDSLMGRKTDMTNFALLTEILPSTKAPSANAIAYQFIDALADQVGLSVGRNNTYSTSLRTMLESGDHVLQRVFPGKSLERILRWLQKMVRIYPLMLDDRSRFIVPEVKTRGFRARTNKRLQALRFDESVIDGLFVGGDALVSTNLFDAHINGLVIGANLTS